MLRMLMHSAVVVAIATAVVPRSTNGSVVVEVEPCDSFRPSMRNTTFATVAQAQRHVRALRTAGASGKIVVHIGEGVHAPFEVGPANSGLHGGAHTVYRGSGSGTVISGGVEIPPALFKQTKRFAAGWDITVDGNKVPPRYLSLNGTATDLFQVVNVTAGGPQDPRQGLCKRFHCARQNILQRSADNGITWMLAAALDCGNGWQKVSLATFHAERVVLTADISSLGLSASDLGEIRANECIHECGTTRALLSFALTSTNSGEYSYKEMVLARWPNYDGARGRNVYAHVASGGPGSFVAQPGGDADVRSNITARMLTWAASGTGWAHGYWTSDWQDCYRKLVTATPAAGGGVNFSFAPADKTPKHWARFYVTNLLTELDAEGEYFVDVPKTKQRSGTAILLHLIPPAGQPSDPAMWARGPVLGLRNASAVVDLSNSSHVELHEMHVLHGRNVGVLADNVSDVHVVSVNSSLHTRHGVHMVRAVDSTVQYCTVAAVGCEGIRAHGGSAASLEPGNVSVIGNTVSQFARHKRTYQAGIHWSGVGNVYSRNSVSDAPHVCFLGGGNEADTDSLAGVDCRFEGNIISNCTYEGRDAGAFYVCGQSASAFVNRGNVLQNNTFKHVRNTVPKGAHGFGTVQAVYLDDQMSGWTLENNTFIDCNIGTWLGGGRRNIVVGNRYERCGTAVHIDNRGTRGGAARADQCDDICLPLSDGCQCNTGAAEWMATRAPASEVWHQRFPQLRNMRNATLLGQPAYCNVSDNTYCECGMFIDATQNQTDKWNTTVENNINATFC